MATGHLSFIGSGLGTAGILSNYAYYKTALVNSRVSEWTYKPLSYYP